MQRLIVFGALGGIAGFILLSLLRGTVGYVPYLILCGLILIVFGFIIAKNLRTNRKVPDATPEARQRALSFAAEPGQAALYLLRTQFVGKAVGMNISLDGREVTQLKSPRFTRIDLAPGGYTISASFAAQPKSVGALEISAGAGDVIVVRCEVEPQMMGVLCKLKRVELADARRDLERTRMVAAEGA